MAWYLIKEERRLHGLVLR